MQDMLDILTRAVNEWQPADRPANRPLSAPQLAEIVDVSLQQHGSDVASLEQAIKDYLYYSPAVYKPDFNKLLFSGQNEPALLGDWVTAMANANMHTYQMAPVATLMELELIKQWNQLIGFASSASGGDGIMVSGGSQANLISMMLARHKACPDYKTKGAQGRTLVAYVSNQAHYSAEKAIHVLGLGTDNLIAVDSSEDGRMCPQALQTAVDASLAQGHIPFYIGLTVGTTVVGAYDDVYTASTIAKANNIWLHIDGAWGGPILFSAKHKHLLAGSELADSFTWDAHKLMNVPITAAAVLVKDAGILKDCSSGGGGDYLFHADANSAYNLGQRSIQCGRRADALKVWLSWKAIGSQGFAHKVDYLMDLKDQCVQIVEANSKLTMLAPAVYLNVLFQYRPAGISDAKTLKQINVGICKTLQKDGKAFIDYANYKGQTGIRLILANDETNTDHLQTMMQDIVTIGDQLSG
ncbi:MAG TPA: glutamate decarboxylase [Oceanospirillaceae bacterium]|nr:glutamate decarboxylase [Oceanospirillaceae bacterium]